MDPSGNAAKQATPAGIATSIIFKPSKAGETEKDLKNDVEFQKFLSGGGTGDPNRVNKKKDKGAGKVLNSSEAAKKIVNAERVGSGLKGDIYHRAASYLSESQISKGTVYDLGKNNTLLQVEGVVNGKTGIFEYILNKSGQVTHQLFKEGGIINGIPN